MFAILCNRHTTLRVEAFSDAPGAPTSMSSAERFFPSCMKSETCTRSMTEGMISKFQCFDKWYSAKYLPSFFINVAKKQAKAPSSGEKS